MTVFAVPFLWNAIPLGLCSSVTLSGKPYLITMSKIVHLLSIPFSSLSSILFPSWCLAPPDVVYVYLFAICLLPPECKLLKSRDVFCSSFVWFPFPHQPFLSPLRSCSVDPLCFLRFHLPSLLDSFLLSVSIFNSFSSLKINTNNLPSILYLITEAISFFPSLQVSWVYVRVSPSRLSGLSLVLFNKASLRQCASETALAKTSNNVLIVRNK